MQLARTARKQLETDAKCENGAMHGKTDGAQQNTNKNTLRQTRKNIRKNVRTLALCLDGFDFIRDLLSLIG